jgi:hypothetical protein
LPLILISIQPGGAAVLRIGFCNVKVCVSDACRNARHVKNFRDARAPEGGPHWILPGYNGLEADNVRADEHEAKTE